MARIMGVMAVAAATAIMLVWAPPAGAAYPGTNGRIAFVRPDSNYSQTGDIWTVAANGSSPRRLTTSNDNSGPAWSPNGKLIAFASSRAGSWDVWVMNADGSGLRRITTAASNEKDPTWSPDGRWIAFSSDRLSTDTDNPRAAIYKVHSTAPYGSAVQITHPGVDDVGGYEYDWAPSWSTSGRIFFSRESQWPFNAEPPWSSIYSVAAAGGAVKDELTNVFSNAWNGDIAPDGKALAWSSDEGSDGFFDPPLEIMMRTASGVMRLVTPERLNVTTADPAWSPDGKLIAYDRQIVATGATSVYTILPTGTGAHAVIANALYPTWQPLPK